MTQQVLFYDEQVLLERLQDELAHGTREMVVLAGSALTMPIAATDARAAIPGVPLAEGIVERIRATLGANGPALDEALRNASNRYQEAFHFLRGRRSPDAVNRIVRKAVLEARFATAAPPSEAVHKGEQGACDALEQDVDGWALSPGVEALGRLAAGHDPFVKRILTTNFDPLIEVAVMRHRGAYHCSVLHGDGSLGQTSGTGTHVVHLHGHWYKADALSTETQLRQSRPQLGRSLKHLLSKCTVLVVAYSGWDDVFTRALAEVMEDDEAVPDVIWTFYDADEARIRRDRAPFFASLERGIGRGRIAFYSGINVHTVLPRLAQAVLGAPGIETRPSALQKHLRSGQVELPGAATPATYLVARHQVVPFAGRETELATLDRWADDGDAVRVLLMHGSGGMGKTRLLTEWLARHAARRPGDAIGFLFGALDDAAIDALCATERAIVVIDYAEERAGLDALLGRVSELAMQKRASGRYLRLVLLARNAGDWWASLRGRSSDMGALLSEPPFELRALTGATQDGRMAEYRRAHAAFVEALQRQPADARSTISIVTRLDVEPDLRARHFERPLYVHMAALSAVLGKPQAGGARDILDEILGHEQRYWARYLGLSPDDGKWRDRVEDHARQAAAAMVARGSCAREDLPVVMEALGFPDSNRICALLQDLYPDPDPARSRAWVVALEPDLVAEALLCRVLERHGRPEEWLVKALTGIEPLHWEHVFAVLGRMGVGYDETMARMGNHVARMLLHGDVAGRAEAMFRAALALTEHTAHSDLGRILADALSGGEHVAVARALDGRMPEETVSLRELAVQVDEILLASLGEHGDLGERARRNNNLGVRYSGLGRRKEALEATERAVALYEELAAKRPDAFLPNLATSLNNLGVSYKDVGRREEALRVTERTVGLYEELVVKRPDAFLPDLAGSLNNLGVRYSELGKPAEALEATGRSVQIREELAAKRPDAFLPDLAASLDALGIRYSKLGRLEEALEATQRAVQIREELAAKRPDAFSPDLAASLNNLGVRYSQLERREEALRASGRSVQIREELAAKRPDAFSPDLAKSLAARSHVHRDLGNGVLALRDIVIAVDHLWPYFEHLPAAFAGLMGAMLVSYTGYLDGAEPEEIMAERLRRYVELIE